MALTDFIEKTLENKLSLYIDKLCNKYSILDRLELKNLIKETLGINVEETRREFLEREWDPDNEYPFSHYKNGSNFKAKWICSKNCYHKWTAQINTRLKGVGCPCCNQKIAEDYSNSLFILNINLAKQWDPANNITSKQVSLGSNKIVKWICDINSNHKWSAQINSRVRGSGCPYCAGKKIAEDYSNSLAVLRPDLKDQWDPTNDISPYQVSVNCGKIVKWICSFDPNHKWLARIANRTKQKKPTGCPCCCNQKVSEDGSNSLGKLYPHLVKEWNSDELSPYKITPGSEKMIKWKCKKGHEWKTVIHSRTRKNNPTSCPHCNESRGEKFINEYLTENNIEFFTQYKISYNECSNLRFDFYIEKYNTCIEFDGIQHFDIISHFGDEYNFAVRVRNDIYKNSHCRENNMTLIRIHHLDINDTGHLSDLISKIDIENPRIITSKNYPENWIN